jgi:hypothetical protein
MIKISDLAMSTGSWLKTHRKQVITHLSIVLVFALFVIFVSEPLFDKLEAVQGESRLHNIPLPAETGGIRYWFDDFVTDGQAMVEVRGWAFIWGQNSDDQEVYVVLDSADRTYVFSTETAMKKGVTEHFKELGLNLDYSAFRALIPARRIADGEYTVGIYIKKSNIEALQYTARTVMKSQGTVEVK